MKQVSKNEHYENLLKQIADAYSKGATLSHLFYRKICAELPHKFISNFQKVRSLLTYCKRGGVVMRYVGGRCIVFLGKRNAILGFSNKNPVFLKKQRKL